MVDKLVLAAIHAPNHKMTLPFKFIFAGPKTRSKLCELSVELKSKSKPMTEIAISAVQKKYNTEGSLLIATMKKSTDPVTNKEDYASLACAIQNISLCLHEWGYGSKWSTGEIVRSEKTFDILNLDYSKFEIVGFIWMGKYSSAPPAPERSDVHNYLEYSE